FLDSSVAYQGAGRELERHEIASLSLWAVEGLLPHRTILLDLPSEALKQRRDPAQLDRLEQAGLEFHESVRKEFLELAAAEPERFAVIDGTQSREEIHAQILEVVAEVLELFDPTFEPQPAPSHRYELSEQKAPRPPGPLPRQSPARPAARSPTTAATSVPVRPSPRSLRRGSAPMSSARRRRSSSTAGPSPP